MQPKPIKVRRAKLNGKTYRIRWKKIPKIEYIDGKGKWKSFTLYGMCEDPKYKDRTITINTEQGEKELLDTVAHECFGHGINFRTSEKKVIQIAKEMTDLLWSMGWRLRLK